MNRAMVTFIDLLVQVRRALNVWATLCNYVELESKFLCAHMKKKESYIPFYQFINISFQIRKKYR